VIEGAPQGVMDSSPFPKTTPNIAIVGGGPSGLVLAIALRRLLPMPRYGSMNKHLVFVYGTLRRGSAGAMSIRFPNSKFIADATVSGGLYDLGAYPGLLSNESNSLVIGEVEVDDEILNQLDVFEASSNYWRKQVEISLGTNRMTC
jgi:gamma-glutamylcyclotransferase (GGCT)/AIG2-like uncharacterized protein YtfP